MSQIGRMNTLRVMREVEFGVYLDGEELGDILLPKRQVPQGTKVNDLVEVFLYFDSSDLIIASTKKPHAQIDEFANLRVVENNKMGAFMDWGLPKDLLVPFREQRHKMMQNQKYIVRIYLDKVSNRIVASTKLDKFLSQAKPPYKSGDKVDLFITMQTDLGYKCIVDEKFWGLLYKDQVFKALEQGQSLKGFIRQIRPDGKIDLSINDPENLNLDQASQKILDVLKANKGFLPMTDKTRPEVIYEKFGISKKIFKRSLGGLYKKRLVKLESKGIRLL
ncbi:MAG: GntR family transcriptional regulator [Candidatus Marinimicrobia bacterium]|nr:GntR family transcriptional regulator [Candidatus Neomarinimicrobiota bacterium]